MKLRTTLLAGIAIGLSALVASAQVPGVNSTLNAVFTLAYDQSTMKPTYSSTAIVVPAAAATDVCTLQGSATTNVRLRRLVVSGLASVVQSEVIGIVKRSAIDTGGTQTVGVAVPYDTTNSLSGSTTNAATAVSENFTANPTLGALVGALADFVITWGNLTTGVGGQSYTYEFGTRGSPVVLRGAAQQVALNLNGNTLTSGQIACTWEWTEE